MQSILDLLVKFQVVKKTAQGNGQCSYHNSLVKLQEKTEMKMTTCKADNCVVVPSKGNEYCHYHKELYKKHGNIEALTSKCRKKNCGNTPFKFDYCTEHMKTKKEN